ncbi:hypothetical protein H6F74_27395 [Trichocoleus sp. FACHB-90]|nr:hypothetical protein [Trichocoleus sp. FACHB-90]MBD1929928.1 hypothetical protein [Trichocoleus sp. FACHB-90]
MPESLMLGTRCPMEWQEKICWIAEVSEPKEVEVVRECDRDLSVQD